MRVIKRYGIVVIGLAVSVLAVASIFTQIDVNQLVEAFRSARYIFVLPSLVCILAGLWARGIRWRVLLNDDLSTLRAFNIMNIGYMVNGVLPLRLGEIGRAYLASQAAPTLPMMRALSTIVVERLLDVLSVLVLMGIAIAAAPVHEDLRRIAAAATPTMILGFAILIGMAAQRERTLWLTRQIVQRVSLLERLHVDRIAAQFLDGLMPLTHPRLLGRTLLWTLVAWFFSILSGIVLMPAFFDAPDTIAVLLFSAAASFANALPAAPGSLGTYEYAILISFQSLGYQNTAGIIGFAVMIHALNLGSNAILGIWGLLQEGLTLNQLSERVKGLQQPSSP
ncbi:MAG: lysylphosphatidylglycerol synthase transmembrane domain-containing protein [bacterium]|nr:lysylphosphatidylglycerol synthase transmembrane domain-containing protein [bacterium]